MEYIAHVQTVCTRPLLGGEGPGDEASYSNEFKYSIFHVGLYTPELQY